MNVYLKELSTALAVDPAIDIDIFTREQNPNQTQIIKLKPNIRIIHISGGPECFIDRQSLNDYLPEFVENLKAFIRNEKKIYDVIYSHYWLSGLVGEQLKDAFSIPLVHTYHTLAFLKDRVFHGKEPKNRIQAERHLSNKADLIISSSSEEKNNLMEEYRISSSKIKVVYPGVNQNIFSLSKTDSVYSESGFSENHQILLYVGRVEPIKGLMTVIEALALLKQSDNPLSKKLKLIVIGGGKKDSEFSQNNEVKRVKDAVREFGLTGEIFFLGSIEQNELKAYYSAADALVVPSFYESFGLVVVEAMACGTPVLVANVGKMRSLVKVGNNGFLFTPGSSKSLRDGLIELYQKKDIFWEKEKIRQDIIDRFSWAKTAKEIQSIFSILLKGKSSLPENFDPMKTLG